MCTGSSRDLKFCRRRPHSWSCTLLGYVLLVKRIAHSQNKVNTLMHRPTLCAGCAFCARARGVITKAGCTACETHSTQSKEAKYINAKNTCFPVSLHLSNLPCVMCVCFVCLLYLCNSMPMDFTTTPPSIAFSFLYHQFMSWCGTSLLILTILVHALCVVTCPYTPVPSCFWISAHVFILICIKCVCVCVCVCVRLRLYTCNQYVMLRGYREYILAGNICTAVALRSHRTFAGGLSVLGQDFLLPCMLQKSK